MTHAVLAVTRTDQESDGLTCSIAPNVSDDDLAQVMVSIFATIAARPGLDLMRFQLQMAGAMQALQRPDAAGDHHDHAHASRGEGSE